MSQKNRLAVTIILTTFLWTSSVMATTFFKRQEVCAVCGDTVDVQIVASTTSFGTPDLDTRPPPLARYALSLGVVCCPKCGYCSSDVSKRIAGADSLIASVGYLSICGDSSLPELARSYLCSSFLLQASGDFAAGGWQALSAAWVCDDRDGPAARCRMEAYRLFRRAVQTNQRFGMDIVEELTVMAEILRRAGQFEDARLLCDSATAMAALPRLEQILKYESTLIKAKDADCHTVAEAVKQK